MRICTTCGHESGEPFQFCPACGTRAPTSVSRRQQRKRVTVLFCDVTDSTALGESIDPEALRVLLARYFDRMRTIVERHGGTVEKFIGDAVMAVFGVPVVHEDDALRALRAADEMRGVFPELGLSGRIGLNSGEVVTGTKERLATGDAVNVAARLQGAAASGEILIGASTLRLARDVVEVEPLEPLVLKGKAEPVPAYRVISLGTEGAPPRRSDAPLVGRSQELEILRHAWRRSVSEHSCQLFTLLGAAGVGKSRLVDEFLGTLDSATVVRGQCLSYGEGITYWPVVSILKQLFGDDRPVPLQPSEFEPSVAAPLLGLLQEEGGLSAPPTETAWAFRKLLEAEAARQPVVCVLDDLHWAEPTLLDLVEHIADLSRGAPLLVLCLARPELLDRRPGWAGGKLNATTTLLEPLVAEQIDLLITNLLDGGSIAPDLRDRILVVADGNPLFVEEMLAFVGDTGDVMLEVPATIQALLAARIDQLGIDERAVLENASVEGQTFHRSAVEALTPDEPDVGAHLVGLVRKELVRPDRPQIRGEDAFRFRHLLVRDAAYEGLPKAVRAELHERFAGWLELHAGELVEADEILGYHLERAFRFRAELGETGDRVTALAASAGRRLATAGIRAFERLDDHAAVSLLRRALAALPEDERVIDLVQRLAWALLSLGRDDGAGSLLVSEEAAATQTGDEGRALRARLTIGRIATVTVTDTDYEAFRTEVERAVSYFESTGDQDGLADALGCLVWVEHVACRHGTVLALIERAQRQAPNARATRFQHENMALMAHKYGPTPVADVLAFIDAREYPEPSDRALPLAMSGDFETARGMVIAERARQRDRGSQEGEAVLGQEAYEIEELAGDLVGAEREARAGCQLLLELERPGFLCLQAAQLALALVALDRLDEAEHWLDVAEDALSPGDVIAEIYLDRTRAQLAARRDDYVTAIEHARAAVTRVAGTDLLYWHGETLREYADIQLELGSRDEGLAALRQALDHYTRKGVVPRVTVVEAHLAQLATTAVPSTPGT